jgi:hypothetical protein
MSNTPSLLIILYSLSTCLPVENSRNVMGTKDCVFVLPGIWAECYVLDLQPLLGADEVSG